MREYPYSILLDLRSSVTKDFPSQQDKATLIYIRNLRITDIQYIENPDLIKPVIEGIENTDIWNGLKIPGGTVVPKFPCRAGNKTPGNR